MLRSTIYRENEELAKLTSDQERIAYIKTLSQQGKKTFLYFFDLELTDNILAHLPPLINDCQLDSFNLLGKTIGNETVKSLVEVLKNSSLKRLHFGGSGIDDIALLSLGEAINKAKQLNQFSISCSANISDKALLQFFVCLAENTKITETNINGFVCSREKSSQIILKHINNFFAKLVKRNQQMVKEVNDYLKQQIYNNFALKWNAQLVGSEITIKFHIPSLKGLSLFAVQNQINAEDDVAIDLLPGELRSQLYSNSKS